MRIFFNNLKSGDLNSIKVVQDYIMHGICKRANDLKIPYQIHTGMANLYNSNPVHLENIIQYYQNINFILLHCYPFINEANYLARAYGNVYVDTAWLYLNSPSIFEDALNTYIGYLPDTKCLISNDATTLEEFVGSMIGSKKFLMKVLFREN